MVQVEYVVLGDVVSDREDELTDVGGTDLEERVVEVDFFSSVDCLRNFDVVCRREEECLEYVAANEADDDDVGPEVGPLWTVFRTGYCAIHLLQREF